MFAALPAEGKKSPEAPAQPARTRESTVPPAQTALPRRANSNPSPTQSNVATHSTPLRPADSTSRHEYRPDHNHMSMVRNDKQSTQSYHTVAEDQCPQYHDDRTGVLCDYGFATPWDPPVRTGTPAVPDDAYRPKSPDLTGLPHTDRITTGRVKKKQQPNSNLRYASARPNRYGSRYVVAPKFLAEMAAWAERQPAAAPPQIRPSYNGPVNPYNTPWTLSRSPNSEAFDYSQWFSEATVAGAIQAVAKDSSVPTHANTITTDRYTPHPQKLQVDTEAAISSLAVQQELRSERQGADYPLLPEHDRYAVTVYQPPQNIPIRFRDPSTYKALNISELRKEAELRRLNAAENTKRYLVEVLTIDDEAFFDCYGQFECRGLDTAQLRDWAILNQVPLDIYVYYNHRQLLAEIAAKAGRDAANVYNRQLQEREAAMMQAANLRAERKQREEPARKAQEAEIEKAKRQFQEKKAAEMQGVNERAERKQREERARKAQEAEIEKAKRQLQEKKAAEMQAVNERAERKRLEERARKAQQIEFEKVESTTAQPMETAAPDRKSRTKSSKKVATRGDRQPSDSGYSTNKVNSSTSPDSSGQERIRDQGIGEKSKTKKRSHSDLAETEDALPSKKVKKSPVENIARPIKPKRVRISKPLAKPAQMVEDKPKATHISRKSNVDVEMNDIEQSCTTKLSKRVVKMGEQQKAPVPKVAEPSKRVTRSRKIAEKPESVPKKKKSGRSSDSEDFLDDDDWIVDDMNYKPKRKSKVAAMAASGLFAGMK
ncbi:hypothetical protein N0V83_000734 [Neocucurbitaria cava]|uniref:Uncharacterized protein n=1 Tax=Neocucurbitaria cava TaxID=798079 RepID=A0A9W9CSE8_9PLEO|nr:hypothetical protein N0V83_000734 [Neocucurbitaria cava]